MKQMDKINLPITKFDALLKLLRKAVSGYGHVNKVKAIIFNERLQRVVETYNNRDKLVFTSEVVSDFVNGLSDELLKILPTSKLIKRHLKSSVSPTRKRRFMTFS